MNRYLFLTHADVAAPIENLVAAWVTHLARLQTTGVRELPRSG